MIPLSTTTITIRRIPQNVELDPYDAPPAPAVVAAGVRAHISTPSGREKRAGGSQTNTTRHLDADPCDLKHTDTVTDDVTGVLYTVSWAKPSYGMGLDRMEAGLEKSDDLADD